MIYQLILIKMPLSYQEIFLFLFSYFLNFQNYVSIPSNDHMKYPIEEESIFFTYLVIKMIFSVYFIGEFLYLVNVSHIEWVILAIVIQEKIQRI
jgi:hypothetical protein